MHYFDIFGLTIASEIPLPESIKIQAVKSFDVKISFGEISFDLLSHPNTKNPGGLWHFCLPDKNRLYFRCNGVDFAVTFGNSIVIDSHGQPYDEARLRIFTLGTAIGGIHIQRGNLPVHGTAVENTDGVTIITGFSGVGKSAILGALTQMGYRYLSDDVSIVKIENETPVVLPAYPQRKIAIDTAQELGYSTTGLEIINEDGRDKYVIRDPREWQNTPMPVRSILELVPIMRKDNSPFIPELANISGHAALSLVMRNLYRRAFYDQIGFPPEQMKKILVLTSSIQVMQMLRPLAGLPVAKTAQIIANKCFGRADNL